MVKIDKVFPDMFDNSVQFYNSVRIGKVYHVANRMLTIELTNYCNLSCKHCMQDKNSAIQYLSYTLMEKIIKEAALYGFNLFSFTGGEPTQHPDFEKIISLTAKNGYYYTMITNGLNFLQAYRAILSTKDKLRMLYFSLDGATQKSHDGIRGDGSFVSLMEAMDLCVKKNILFAVQTVVTKFNCEQIREIMLFSKIKGAQFNLFFLIFPTFNNYHLFPSDRQLARLSAILELNDIRSHSFRSNIFRCPSLSFYVMNINYCGEITFCCTLSNYDKAPDPLSDVAGSLEKLGFADGQKELLNMRHRFYNDVLKLLAENKWDRYYNFPCFYCAKYFNKVDEKVFRNRNKSQIYTRLKM